MSFSNFITDETRDLSKKLWEKLGRLQSELAPLEQSKKIPTKRGAYAVATAHDSIAPVMNLAHQYGLVVLMEQMEPSLESAFESTLLKVGVRLTIADTETGFAITSDPCYVLAAYDGDASLPSATTRAANLAFRTIFPRPALPEDKRKELQQECEQLRNKIAEEIRSAGLTEQAPQMIATALGVEGEPPKLRTLSLSELEQVERFVQIKINEEDEIYLTRSVAAPGSHQ